MSAVLEPLAILRRDRGAPLPEGLVAEGIGPLWLVSGPAARVSGFTLRRRRQAILRAAGARQALLERLMPLGPVLALPPGLRLTVEDLLPCVPELQDWLDRLAGRVQFQLQVSWDRKAAASRFSDRLEGTGEAALNRLSAELAAGIETRLEPLVVDIQGLPVDGPEMILNRVLLVAARDEMRLDAVLDEVDALWPEGLRLRLVGPSPAVSFALARLRPVSMAELRGAAEAVGHPLPPAVTGPVLASLREALPDARRRLLLRGADPAPAHLLARLCALALPDGPVDRLSLLDVLREGSADPVAPSSLPAPDPETALDTEERRA